MPTFVHELNIEMIGLLLGGVVLLSIRETIVNLEQWQSAGLTLSGTLLISVASAKIGRANVVADASELAKPLVRPAFRRTLSLYRAFGRLAAQVASERDRFSAYPTTRRVSPTEIAGVLTVIEARLLEQLDASNDAIDEWGVVMVDEVAGLKLAAKDARDD